MSKVFYTNGVGSAQTIENADSNKVKVFETKADAVAALSNLENGEIVSTTIDPTLVNNDVWFGTYDEYQAQLPNIAPNTICFVYDDVEYISLSTLKSVVAASSSFADFQARVAAL